MDGAVSLSEVGGGGGGGGGGCIRESVRSRPRPRDEGEDGRSP